MLSTSDSLAVGDGRNDFEGASKLSDNSMPEDDGRDDESSEAERRATFRQALMEAGEADIILLTGMSRADWLMQLDGAPGGSGG